MPYLSTFERCAKEEGLREGLIEAIAVGLKLRFGDRGAAILPQIQGISEVERLRSLTDAILRTERLEDFCALLPRP